jgi:3'(2'), 5'-bisphosphate nucleotidase
MTRPTDDEVATRLAFARRIAADCGQRLLHIRSCGRWPEGPLVGDVGDQAADGYLQGSLRARFPDDGLLSEETTDGPERLARRWTWIVDPLDGTKEYTQGRHDWAVHVGIACDGTAVAGALALPAVDRVATGVCLPGAERAELTGGGSGEWPMALPADPGPDAPRRLRMVCSRSHTPELVHRIANGLDAELVPCGSVGFKVAMLLFGQADLYVHKKGLREWDVCAPEAVARAAGFVVCRFDGELHRYNRPDPRSDEIVVCRPWLRDRVLALLGG